MKISSVITSIIQKRCFFTLFITLLVLKGSPLFSQQNDHPIIRTPQFVKVNTEVPKGSISNEEPIPVSFSKIPTDEEIFRVHFFEEPLVPANTVLKLVENSDLVYALIAYSQRINADDFTSLTRFLEKYPNSRWQGALLANLGLIYRRTGYYNMAMDAWQKAWSLMKKVNEPKAKVLADRVISELLLINGWVGRMDTIALLLNEIKDRTMQGPAVERIISMKHSLWIMKNRPGVSFKCGPYALSKIYTLHDSTKSFSKKMMDVQSTPKGFSLFQLQKMAKQIGLKYQMAFRTPGSIVIPKAVIHWKLDHYSTLLKLESGHYKCEDATAGTTYGQEFWLTPAALDSSASGYFLVPEGVLPKGWRKVSVQEGNAIFGKGQVMHDKGKDVSDHDKQLPETCDKPTPMAQSNVHAAAVSLHIYDRPVYYTPPKGPAIFWNVDYHQRDTYQPANFTYSNMGPKWTFNWLSYVQDNPNDTTANADVYEMGGGDRTFVLYNTATHSYAPELQTNDVLVRTCPNCYELRHPDGSKEVYERNDGNTAAGRKIFLTKKVDVAGNIVSLTYDGNLRITSLKDALGQVTKIQYESSEDYKVKKVIDPFGRSAQFEYDGSGRLSKITDMIGIVSSFQYNAGDFINSMTTPYGTTSFISQDSATMSAIETHYPLDEKERVEFRDEAPGISMTESIVPDSFNNAINNYMAYRNTFYWDKKAMKMAPRIYTQATIYHWLHGSSATSEDGNVAPILESEKAPLENRVWYAYQNQPVSIYSYQGMSARPSKIGRVLDDGTTQLYQYSYNSLGADTMSVDPFGRKFKYVYDSNKIDLLEVRQIRGKSNELLAKYTYNSHHLRLTSKDASGLTTQYTYNAAGQLLTIKNPNNETTTLAYDSKGYLQSINGAVAGAIVNFAYDGFGRTRTVTDPEGYTITTDYDKLDRPTLITYPDSSYEQIEYDRLDAVHQRDRLGRWSHTIYDSLDRKSADIDALGRITQFLWCSCGSLSEIIDPLKNVTSFVRDIQGRLILKTYLDGKSITYTYENTTSRLKEVVDAKGQTASHTYFIDNNLKQLDYTNAVIPTHSVAYTYDTSYNRVLTMIDGTGKTTYTYKKVNSGLGSGMLSSEKSPLSNGVIDYKYDSLGRMSSRAINGTALTLDYDKLGRITAETNALGAFAYNYVNQTQRLSSMTYPNGQSTVYDYYDNSGDDRLKEVWNKKGNGTLSKFDYGYNKEGQITKWTQQSDAANVSYYDLGYDLADQLTSATLINGSSSAIAKRYTYQYDKGGNRTSEQIDNTITGAVYNNLNQLVQRKNNGPIRVKGTVSEPSSVLVKNVTTSDSLYATVDSATNSFEAFVKTVPGTDSITITATDYSGNNNKRTNSYNITVGSGVNDTLSFDDNGNTIAEANPAVTYSWDAADRLVKIIKGSNVTEFVYDGLSRRVAEKLNGTTIKTWLWCGTELCEERNAGGGTVTKRFFRQGEQINGINYYFTKDHLGSVIEMTDAAGVIKARYNYDPYGKKIKVSGSLDADFGFTGHYYHAATGLHLALYRAYDGNVGRWLSRDPITESTGFNLYNYVYNNPINNYDLFGLKSEMCTKSDEKSSLKKLGLKDATEIAGGVAGSQLGGIIGADIGVGIGIVAGGLLDPFGGEVYGGIVGYTVGKRIGNAVGGYLGGKLGSYMGAKAGNHL